MNSHRPLPPLDVAPAPLEEDVVLSPEWLTSVVRGRHPDATIRSVERVERLETVAAKVRFRVEYAELVPGAPTNMCVKGYFNPELGDRLANGQTEVRFYQELTGGLGLQLPTCLYAAIDPETGHGLILMEDLVAQGATFNSALRPFTPEEAALTLTQLARLHAARWADPALASISLLDSKLDRLVHYVSMDRLQEHLDGPRATLLPASIREAARVQQALLTLSQGGSDVPDCIVHGDAHAGNTYRTADGEMGLVDWQIVRRGSWALDVAYHVASVLDVDERERSEESLVEHYLQSLSREGVAPPDWDTAWLEYRRHLAYGYYLWGITKMVDPPIINEFAHRLGSAVAFHGTFKLLGV